MRAKDVPNQPPPQAWLAQAVALVNDAYALHGTIPDPPVPEHCSTDTDSSGEMAHNFSQIVICTMLYGMATENALKGIHLARGLPVKPRHNLVELAFELGIQPLADDLGIPDSEVVRAIAAMERAVIWATKYPAPIRGRAPRIVLSNDHVLGYRIATRIIRELASHLGATLTP